MRLIYKDFSKFTGDQEHLISTHRINGPNYVEGSIITENTHPNNWRSSFYSPSHLSKIANLMMKNKGILYSIDVVKYYDHQTIHTIDHVSNCIINPIHATKNTISFHNFQLFNTRVLKILSFPFL